MLSRKLIHIIQPRLFTAVLTALLLILVLTVYQVISLNSKEKNLSQILSQSKNEITRLKHEDQRVRNDKLQQEIDQIQKVFKKASNTYETLADLKLQLKKTDQLDSAMAKSIKLLSDRNYGSAEAELNKLDSAIQTEKNKLTATESVPLNVPQSNTPPGSGYSRQSVSTLGTNFLVDIVAADLNSTKVIVDTASDGDCSDNCPVLSLADYVGRSGAFAGVNGSYFCPATYPSCAGKTNSFDTLLMNKNKVYFNSANNVYSAVPVAIFSGGSVRYALSQEWGRDTSVDAVIANQPLLVSGGNAVFGGDNEIKRLSKGSRSFVGSSGNTVYIGVVHNVNAAEMARVLAAMGIQYALNLDSGGSTALWDGGYKVGPGRNIPNALLFIRR